MGDDTGGYAMFAPDGTVRQVPDTQYQAALAAGGKVAIRMTDPQGNVRYVPHDQATQAIQAGGKPAPNDNGIGLWQAFKDTLPGAGDILHAVGLPANKDELDQMAAEESKKTIAQKLKQGPPGGWLGAFTGPGGPALLSMGKEAGRAAINPTDPMAPIHAAASMNPFAASAIDQMSQQGLGTKEAGATGLVNAVPMLAGEAVSKLNLEGLAQRGYQSALKPSLARTAPNPAALAKTGVEAGIPVSEAGQVKLQGLIDDLNDTIQGKIKSGSQAGATVEPADIAKRLDALKSKFSNQVLPAEDLQTIEDAKQAFLKAHPSPMSLEDTQAMKQGTYQQLRGKYGQQSAARTEAEKALARGAKEELETQFPEIKGLNAQEGKLINLDVALERAVRRIGNHQLVGIGTPIVAGAVGGTAGGPAGITAGILKALVDDPMVKSKLAIALNKGGRGTIPMAAASSRISAYSGALGQTQAPAQSDDER